MNLNEYNLDLGGGSLLQVANRTLTQMMSYIIETPEGGTVVIDGGNVFDEDADNLYRELKNRGGKVDMWIITHAHSDHFGALLNFLRRESLDVEIEKLVFNFPEKEWLKKKEEAELSAEFLSRIEANEKLKARIVTPFAGDVYECGGMTFEILCHPVDYEDYPQINPTTVMFKAKFPKREVLFMGDFDKSSEKTYMERFDTSKLRCDIVQMAHHGQGGVSREFYELIEPKYCLYTAPGWLWENNRYRCEDPETRGKGNFTIMETRLWMAQMNVLRSFHQGEGDWLFK
jgi:beta-lactamase superfamily II metal-dependent hydrolase